MQDFLEKREMLIFYLCGDSVPKNFEERFLIKRQAFTCSHPQEFRIWFVLPDGRLHGEEKNQKGVIRTWDKGVILASSN
uniref:Uncharacterized protein n=1 Tax=Marseillevirus sp. TaxID=2809551 RepID=A0AA96ES20_9VIRU|nr:hypothetical protein MarFTMF_200 [Marseillevirus sp.]